jgi:hypothetical protein
MKEKFYMKDSLRCNFRGSMKRFATALGMAATMLLASAAVNATEYTIDLSTVPEGTYMQLQDTETVRDVYPPVEGDGMFPQALLQAFIRQGSGQTVKYAAGSRKESELQLVIPMTGELKENGLLLAGDLYSSYYHFCLILSQKARITVPGKRDRNKRRKQGGCALFHINR